MDRDTFQRHLYRATEEVLIFTRTLVLNDLPSDCRYLVSHREGFNPAVADGQAFPEDPCFRIFQGDLTVVLHLLGPPLDASGVVDDLWRGGKVPQWVNTTVHGADGQFTYFLLRCSGCFTALGDVSANGRPLPFSLRMPSPPPNWFVREGRYHPPDMKRSLEENGRYWIRNFGVSSSEANM